MKLDSRTFLCKETLHCKKSVYLTHCSEAGGQVTAMTTCRAVNTVNMGDYHM